MYTKKFYSNIEIKSLFILCLAFMLLSAFAQAQQKTQKITIPATYQVLKVNGVDYSASFFASETVLALPLGEHNVVVLYENIFEDFSNDDHTKVTSEPFMFSVHLLDEPLRILSPKLADDTEAKEYIKKPDLHIVNQSGQIQPYKLTFLKNVAEQMLTLSRNENLLNESSSEVNNNILDMLNFWWKQASEEEKRLFKAMIHETPES